MAANTLGENHRRHFLHAFLDIHRRLAELEGRLAEASRPSPFSPIVNDLAPAEAGVMLDHFARIRAAMLARLEALEIPLEVRKLSLRWAFDSGLTSILVRVDDMGPRSLVGYGPLDAAATRLATEIQQDLERMIERARAYLQQGLGHDLARRLERLGAARDGLASLAAIERIISRRGLVAYRPALELIVDRLEDPRFEVAVFGRVSSGKSSLLNHIAGVEALPVGVTPVTAVPTRLTYGEAASVTVSFADSGPSVVGLERLAEFASEEENPGNRKHVTGILVRLPSPRLREGVVFVDTPGVGSLALQGGAESLAYLPRCDLGLVLIDAAGTLHHEDLALIRALYESGSPAMLLLSKADLLGPADRDRMTRYIREQVRLGLGVELAVHPVSTVGRDESLLTRWFEEEVRPLLDRHREMARESLRRKAAHLRDSIATALELQLGRGNRRGGESAAIDATRARRLLDDADAALRDARERWLDWPSGRQSLWEAVPEEAARLVLSRRRSPGDGPAGEAVVEATRAILGRRERSAVDLVEGLRASLRVALDGLRASAPALLKDEDAEAAEARTAGLPAADLAPLSGLAIPAGPWWSGLAPRLAIGPLREAIRDSLGGAIRDVVEFHDRRIHAWIKEEVGRLVDRYETLADPVREQLRRPGPGPDATSSDDRAQLEADLAELRGDEVLATAVPPAGHEPSGS